MLLPSITIIIPVLNEAQQLPVALRQWRVLQKAGVEIVVVDGGSDDNSMEQIDAAGFTVFSSERGRARQMNTGASKAQGNYLLFLHADTLLPENSLRALQAALQQSRDIVWGRFDVQVMGKHCLFPCLSALINLRSRLSGIATGDQALFIRRDVFEAIGGFTELPLMEDVEICKRLKKFARPLCLKAKVQTSGRRWQQHGFWKTVLLMWRLRFEFWLGQEPAKLAARYYPQTVVAAEGQS